LPLILQIFLAPTFAVPQSSQTRIIPDAGWVKIYFESIDKLTKRLGFKPLRSIEIKPGDLEVRIWSGFGIQGSGGTIIKRIAGKWSAFTLDDPEGTRGVNGRAIQPNTKKAPKSIDWAKAWEQMELAGIETIKDESEIPKCSEVLDGISWVIEIAKPGYYRTYMQGNPQIARSEDGDKLLHVIAILAMAFGGSSIYDLDKLPKGEEEIVPVFSADISITGDRLGLRANGSEYKVGDIPSEDSVMHLTPEDVLSQGVNLSFPQCYEFPSPKRYLMRFLPEGTLIMEIFIQPDGSVSGAKALSGMPLLANDSLQAASRWKFQPITDSPKIRSTILSIRYQKKWVPYPWLK
jgi:hypothetical protein